MIAHIRSVRLRVSGSAGRGRLTADMARAGMLDLSSIRAQAFPLGQVNEASGAIKRRPGGYSNIVVKPERQIAWSARTQFEGEAP
jgi:hypothetical protein